MWILDSSDDLADSFNVRFQFFFGASDRFLETQRLRSCALEKNVSSISAHAKSKRSDA